MTKRSVSPLGVGRHDSASSRREQDLCNAALDSAEFDGLSDKEWVAMCERIAREEEAVENEHAEA